MTEKEFEEKFTGMLQKAVPERELRRDRVEKLQGQSYEALVVTEAGSCVGVTLSLDRFYQMEESGIPMEEVLESALASLREAGSCPPGLEPESLKNYEELKKNLSIRLVPVRGNEELLEKVPHRKLLDLAAVCRFLLHQDEHGEAGILLTEENLRLYGITQEQLFSDAERAAAEKQPLTIRSLSSVLFGGEEEDTGLWVVSNETGRYGAGVLAYPGTLEKIAEKLGTGFYLIPSSVHELLALPDDGRLSAKELDSMVVSVNTSEVIPEERLTDHSYHYDPATGRFETGTEYEAGKLRMQPA